VAVFGIFDERAVAGAVSAYDTGHEWPVMVLITDQAGKVVFRARIALWVSLRKQA
jgi:hypothetical protein